MHCDTSQELLIGMSGSNEGHNICLKDSIQKQYALLQDQEFFKIVLRSITPTIRIAYSTYPISDNCVRE